MNLHNMTNRAIGLVLLSPFILLLGVVQVVWLPIGLFLCLIAFPFMLGLGIYSGSTLAEIADDYSEAYYILLFTPIEFIRIMLEVK